MTNLRTKNKNEEEKPSCLRCKFDKFMDVSKLDKNGSVVRVKICQRCGTNHLQSPSNQLILKPETLFLRGGNKYAI